ncbi:MAG: hypothetical protein Alis3KO_16360 [Aliiglaciecola sp.]
MLIVCKLIFQGYCFVTRFFELHGTLYRSINAYVDEFKTLDKNRLPLLFAIAYDRGLGPDNVGSVLLCLAMKTTQ